MLRIKLSLAKKSEGKREHSFSFSIYPCSTVAAEFRFKFFFCFKFLFAVEYSLSPPSIDAAICRRTQASASDHQFAGRWVVKLGRLVCGSCWSCCCRWWNKRKGRKRKGEKEKEQNSKKLNLHQCKSGAPGEENEASIRAKVCLALSG